MHSTCYAAANKNNSILINDGVFCANIIDWQLIGCETLKTPLIVTKNQKHRRLSLQRDGYKNKPEHIQLWYSIPWTMTVGQLPTCDMPVVFVKYVYPAERCDGWCMMLGKLAACNIYHNIYILYTSGAMHRLGHIWSILEDALMAILVTIHDSICDAAVDNTAWTNDSIIIWMIWSWNAIICCH